MRKLSEIKNEDALDVLADILEPTMEIFTDTVFKKKYDDGNIMDAVKYVIKAHKKAIIEVLAGLDGVPVNEYSVNVIEIPKRLFELLNDKDTLDFFQSQGLKISDISFGSVMGNTGETETK